MITDDLIAAAECKNLELLELLGLEQIKNLKLNLLLAEKNDRIERLELDKLLLENRLENLLELMKLIGKSEVETSDADDEKQLQLAERLVAEARKAGQ